ncbi:MAG: hypothetical protein UY16_C0016G0027 [Candidatus Gottesmanbacteria bacterium GW2011_GWA2_47_9]|uniref:Uncharacterized protein n=1 Tax=Candidatus Gottesmanbacteria bacterium GW2011_GWA2_47_9 TaxID=1618445 RepID=A0A0G1X0G6_9BACT|nr:MAG: hypothetical protein UY16_C0016G0027 [Candidatus Gottesmanbacteria bacterium GW2011_GWA2_47_9]
MLTIKYLIGVIAVLLTFVGYVPYIRDTIKGKTKPHVYSWFLWGFVTIIAFALQVSGNAGIGSLVTLAAALVSFVIFALGLRNGKKDITKADTAFFIAALIAIVIWVFAKQPVLSVILISTIEMLGFVPTVRKSWNKPHSETLFTYALNAFRHGLSIFALQRYSIVTWLYPVTWTLANGLFSIILLIRRRKLLV